jgi:hypothetical protein
MSFLDKAKKLAEQAQTKLDEAQKQFNQGQSGSTAPPGGGVEYDQHGRPMRSEPPAEPVGPPPDAPTPPHGDPLGTAPATAPPAPPGAAAPVPDPAAPPEGGPPGEPEEDRNNPSYAPPKLSGGDPLAP